MELKLIAFDEEDLAVISAHLQDAVVKVGDMTYLPRERRFAFVSNRFDWASADERTTRRRTPYLRRRAALRFEHVRSAKVHNVDLQARDAVLSLLAISFEPGEAPGGQILLVFAGGAAIRLEVDCVEAELRDLGPAWRTRRRPEHEEDDDPGDADEASAT